MLHSNKSACLALGTAKDNPKDNRLFALAKVSIPLEIKISSKEEKRNLLMTAFENAFMEAVYFIRIEQGKTKTQIDTGIL